MRESRRPRLVLGILLLVAFTLLAIDLRADANGPLGGLKRLTGSVVGPAMTFVSNLSSPVRTFVTNLTAASDRDAQLATLEAEVARLRAVGSSPDTARRLSELGDLLRMSQAGQYRMVPAQVIAAGPSQGFARTITLDVGSRDGIAPDMTVLARGGLAGRVAAVSATTSVVVLLVDPTVSVGGRLEAQGEIGFVSGIGSESELEFQLLDPFGPLQPGDRVVTFGSKSGKPYVPGVPIGQVVEVSGTPGQLTRLAKVRPYVDVSTLDIVSVVVEPPREDPRDAVLLPPVPLATDAMPPLVPSPSATPSPTAEPTQSPEPTPTSDAASPASAP